MKNRFAKKVDRSQPQIVKALRKYRAQIIVTNMGDDFPDLLVGRRALGWKLLEVKELDGSFSRGQLKFLAEAYCPVDIVTSQYDAIVSLTVGRYLTMTEQARISAWLLTNPNQETIRVQKLLKIIGRISNEKQKEKPLRSGSKRSTVKL